MSSQPYQAIETRLSTARLAPYVAACQGDLDDTLALYAWNLRESAAFFVDLSTVEVALRNSIDAILRDKYQKRAGSPPWYDQVSLSKDGSQELDKALKRAEAQVGDTPSHDDVITQLAFGFWKSLLNKRYQASLWPVIRPAFLADPSRTSLTRDYVSDLVGQMNFLRNRIAHHEPVFSRDLVRQSTLLLEVLGLLCQDTRDWVAGQSQIPAVLSERPHLR